MKHVIRKNNYLIHLISHQKSNIEISDLSGHAASNFDPPLPMASTPREPQY